MVQSMTGYGKAVAELPNKKISVEIKSLNSKQIDINTRIPHIYREKDIEIRNILSQHIVRGKVDFAIYFDNTEGQLSSKINTPAIESYYCQIKQIADKLNIAEPADFFSVALRLPETVKTEVVELDEQEWSAIKATILEALKNFSDFRAQEGVMLNNIFNEKIESIANLLKEIEKYDSERIEKIKQKMLESAKKAETISFDNNRFEQELIYYIERLDVNEEKTRLNNHLQYFIETMNTEENQGRKLGFIAQEIGREINTLGSKSNHAEMQKIVVQMKDELEQIKEQVLNTL
ncbi:uncharacterized protein (TIGR00255 family) [Dysgonomonadaceae bacterium PH5-43]|nr:uncharacterized protein (TIGR00255 family) [Dysgonomonadaceae bacterium PH5-43]